MDDLREKINEAGDDEGVYVLFIDRTPGESCFCTVAELKQALAAEWVSVDERNPRESGEYVVQRYESVRMGRFSVSSGCWYGHNEDGAMYRDIGIIAWQEKPQPYRPASPEGQEEGRA